MSIPEVAREGRRERRQRETRRNILRSAVDLFAEHGFDAVTVDEIAARADVARGTVFNHFASKDSLCESVGELQMAELEEAIQDGRVSGPTAWEKVEQALCILAELPGRNADHCRALLTRGLAAMKPGELPEHKLRLFETLLEWVTDGQERGEFRRDMPPCELTGFILGLQFQATLIWAYGFAQGTLAEQMTRVLRLGLEGIRSTDHPT